MGCSDWNSRLEIGMIVLVNCSVGFKGARHASLQQCKKKEQVLLQLLLMWIQLAYLTWPSSMQGLYCLMVELRHPLACFFQLWFETTTWRSNMWARERCEVCQLRSVTEWHLLPHTKRQKQVLQKERTCFRGGGEHFLTAVVGVVPLEMHLSWPTCFTSQVLCLVVPPPTVLPICLYDLFCHC